MDWQENIINRLNLREPRKKIILDKIGLLLSESFTHFLKQTGLQYCIATSIPEILSSLQSDLIITSSDIMLPTYLSSKAEIVEFDEKMLPVDIQSNILSKFSLHQLTVLIDYQINEADLGLIKKSNYLLKLEQVEKYQNRKAINTVRNQIEELLNNVQGYHEFLKLGEFWGFYYYLCFKLNQAPEQELMNLLDRATESRILGGITKNAFFAAISEFKTVDKILHFIKSQVPSKWALICFDGMGAAEWCFLREYLSPEFQFTEKYIYALIPTMTRISRAAIFSNNIEKVYELNLINEDQAFSASFSNLCTAAFREGEILHRDKLLGIDVIKIIYNVFDDLAHKTILPPSIYHKNIYFQNVVNYLSHSSIKNELLLLKAAGYKLWICSDHGSVIATGNGLTIDKYLVESSSKRATIIEKSELAKFYDVQEYEVPFVKDKIILLAKNRTAFSRKNHTEITHGGITLEELIVPFVEVID